MAKPGEKRWVYGWTHFQMAGQTVARMDELTREIEVKDCNKWIRCVAGSDAVFTPGSNAQSFLRQKNETQLHRTMDRPR